MIPLWLLLKIGHGRSPCLWLPLFLLWLLLLPAALLLAPLVAVLCLILRRNPIAIGAALWGLLAGFRGIHVDVQHSHANLSISIK